MSDRLDQFLASAKSVSLTSDERATIQKSLLQKIASLPALPFVAVAQGVGLKSSEKKAGRGELQSFMRSHPSTELRMTTQTSFVERFFSAFTSLRFTAAVMTVAILLTSTGVTYAAEQALPGDLLYDIKVNINEPLWGHMQFGSERKAHWSKRRIERRLEESERLLREGRFTDEHRQRLQERIEHHTERLEQRLANLEDRVPAEDIEAIRAKLEARLEKQEEILSGLEAGTLQDQELQEFMQHIKKRRHGVRERRHRFLEKHPELREKVQEKIEEEGLHPRAAKREVIREAVLKEGETWEELPKKERRERMKEFRGALPAKRHLRPPAKRQKRILNSLPLGQELKNADVKKSELQRRGDRTRVGR